MFICTVHVQHSVFTAVGSALTTCVLALHRHRHRHVTASPPQTAAAPPLAGVFSELIGTRSGNELRLKNPRTSYGIPLGRTLAFAEAAEAVRRQGDTLVGVITKPAHGSDDAAAAEPLVRLGLPAGAALLLGPRDRLVVVAAR
jgi:hypothetical protein